MRTYLDGFHRVLLAVIAFDGHGLGSFELLCRT